MPAAPAVRRPLFQRGGVHPADSGPEGGGPHGGVHPAEPGVGVRRHRRRAAAGRAYGRAGAAGLRADDGGGDPGPAARRVR